MTTNFDFEAEKLFTEEYDRIARRTDYMFATLLVLQWVAATLFTCFFSPLTWSGGQSAMHIHLFVVGLGGGIVTSLPVALAFLQPGRQSTRYVMATSQMAWSTILIHVTGGRIETHFHVFGSLAFLAFYRDVKVFVPATLVVVFDHFARGLYWPESIYGVTNPEWWRTIEHAGWVLFIDAFLIRNCQIAYNDLRRLCSRQTQLSGSEAELRRHADELEERVACRTTQLETSLVELREAQHELEVQHHQTFEFLDKIPLGVIVFGKDGERAFENCIATDALAGHDPLRHEVYRRGGNEIVPRGEFPVTIALQQGIPARRDDLEVEMEHGRRVLDVQAKPIFDRTGHVTYAVVVFDDITDRLNNDADRLQSQKLESVGQLAAGIAHEINTPMQYIGDNTQFVKTAVDKIVEMIDFYDELIADDEALRAQVEERARKSKLDFVRKRIPGALDSTIEGIDRVSQLVRAMKEFSHPGSDKKSPTNLNRAIETTLTVARNEWKYVAEVDLDLDAYLPEVPALPGELNQVLLNIIVNAAHAISDHRATSGDNSLGKITITTSTHDDHIAVVIADDGCGMPASVQDKIFNPFFTTKEVGRGTGQGLALAHSIVTDKHGGTIDVTSEVGAGTTFTIHLPRHHAPIEGAS